MKNPRKPLPKDWQVVNLDDIAQIVNGTTPATYEDEYWGGDIVWITPKDLGKLEGKEIYLSERSITEAGFNSCNLSLIPVDSIVLSTRAPIGYIAINKVELCFNQGCKGIIANKDIDKYYLFYYLIHSRNALEALGSGVTFKELSMEKLKMFEIALPPIDEQKCIVQTIETKLHAVEKAKKAAAEQLKFIDAFSFSILRQAFSGGIDIINEIEAVCGMKRDWKQYRLDEICIIIAGQSPGSYSYNSNKIGLPFYQGKADFGQIFPNPTVWCNEPIKIAEKGDILLSVRAPVGSTNMANEKCCIGRGLCAIRTDENVDRQYLLAYLRSIENELLKMGSGTTFQSITIEDVRKIIIPLLPLDEQKRIIQIIETKLHTVEKAKKAAAEQFQSIDALSSSVLRQALRGKL